MIRIKNLSKTYGKRPALREVSLEIRQGSLFALLGPNGSGKSTLLKSLLGLVVPDPGSEIHVGSLSALEDSSYRDLMAYMPQIPAFPANVKVGEILDLLESLTGEAPFREELVRELGVDRFLDRTFGHLSQGMKQKVNIVQCFSLRRDLIVIDEPTAGLDPGVAFFLKGLIRKRKREGATVLFTSHIMAEVEELADSMALLQEGRRILATSPGALKEERGASTLEEAIRHYWSEYQ